MNRKQLEELLKEFEPKLAAAFVEAMENIKSEAVIADIERALRRGDVETAVRALNIDIAAIRPLDRAIFDAYETAGVAAVSALPAINTTNATRLVVRFNVRNPRAERFLSEHSSTLVQRITDDQINVVRNALTDSLARGRNPRSAALDIVGRVSKGPGSKRTGGVIGLTTQQEVFLRNARDELSGDAKSLNAYLRRGQRDKRFDPTVKKAILNGKRLTQAQVSRISGRYSDGLLRLRGETIARTETLTSIHAGQDEAFRQLIDTGQVRPQDVRRVWRTSSDRRVRDSHESLQGESVGVNERFPNGLRYPGDPSGPAEEIINCRCLLEQRIDFLSNLQ